VTDARTAVVADQLEVPEAELPHEPDLVACHRPLGVNQSGEVRSRLVRVAVAPQVGQHDGVVPGEGRSDMPPDEMVFRVAVQQ
jgi:hypothetical protein